MSPELVYIYFILLIFMGSFFVVNLILAVINDSFLKCQNELKSEEGKVSESKVVPLNREKKSSMSSSTPYMKKSTPTATATATASVVPLKLSIEDEQQNVLSQGQSQQLTPTRSPEKRQARKREGKQGILVWVIESKPFTIFIMSIILLNTLTLALDRYPMSRLEMQILDVANLVFTVIFLLEMVLKMAGYGVVEYFRDSLNLFDSVIVLVSVVEWILTTTNQLGSGSSLAAISGFRTLRLFRMFKLARQWVKLRQLILAIIATLSGIGYFVILLLLFMIIVSLLGMELFAYRLRVQQNRQNFDNFWQSMITIFVLLTNEAWNEIAYDYMKYSMYSLVYFVIVVIIGNFMLLKLFIAILLYNFSYQHDTSSSSNDLQ